MSSTSCVTTIASPKYFLTVLYIYFKYSLILGEERAFQASSQISIFRTPFRRRSFVDEGFHDDDRNHGEQLSVVLHGVNLEDDEPLVQQVDVLVRVQQEVVAPALVILPQRGQEVVDVEILPAHLDVPCSQLLPVIVQHVLVEGVERGGRCPGSVVSGGCTPTPHCPARRSPSS